MAARSRNTDKTRQELDRLRLGRRTGRGLPMSYRGPDGGDLEFDGDREGPWLKTPPFVTRDPIDYAVGLELTDEQNALLPLQVRQIRTMLVWITYRPVDTARLLLGMDAARPGNDSDEDFWHPTAVVSATLSFPGALVAERNFFASQLATPFVGAGEHLVCIPLDVQPYRTVRLRVWEEIQGQGNHGAVDLRVDMNV